MRTVKKVLGGGLEPPRLTAYAPQTYVSAIPPPELLQEGVGNANQVDSTRKKF